MKLIRSFLALGLLAAAPSVATGQTLPGPVSTGAGYEWYGFRQPDAAGLRSLSLLTMPYGAALPVGGGVRLEIGGAYARSVLVRRDGAKTEVEGITDTQLRLRLPLAGDRVVLGAFAVLPTGISTATQEEVEVAGAIASDLLPLRVSHWGSGGGAGLQLTVAHTMGRTGVGMGVSYLVSRPFDPLEEAGLAAYRPGDQLAAQMALTHDVGNAARATLQLSMQRQADDRLETANLFRSGNRYQAVGSYAFRAGVTGSGIVYAGGQHRERGTALLDLTRDTPSQELLLAGGALRMRIGRTYVVIPTLDGRLFRARDGIGQGYLGAVGTGLEITSGGTILTPQVRAHLGRLVVRDGLQSGLVGMDIGVAARIGRGGR